jgi:hypothetical protein
MKKFKLKNILSLIVFVCTIHCMKAQTVQDISSYSNKKWPSDLNKEKLLYVNITPEEYAGSYNMINNSFVNKLKDYPFEYNVLESYPTDSSILNQYKYQFHVSREIIMYKVSVTTKDGNYTRTKNETEAKNQFVSYIQNIKTGEIFCATPDPEWFYSTMKKFVKSVNKQFGL